MEIVGDPLASDVRDLAVERVLKALRFLGRRMANGRYPPISVSPSAGTLA
jgi:hypothetical protein